MSLNDELREVVGDDDIFFDILDWMSDNQVVLYQP